MFKAYKYRIYPNKQQEELIQKTFGCCRFVYNETLFYRKTQYEKEKKSMSRFDCINYVNQVLKKQYEWLKEPDKFALENAVKDMDAAYQNFFKQHTGYPKFKSKKSNYKSYRTTCNYSSSRPTIEVNFTKNKIKFPKIMWIKAKVHRKFTGKIKYATISQVPSGKYFVSILVETEHIPMESTGSIVGIDLGIKNLLITSNEEKFDNIHVIKKYESKLAKAQRQLVRKTKGGKNYEKQRIKVAKIYEKIHNTRIDYLHKISHKLINENQVIVSEDLSISNMIKDCNFTKSILDCSWYELTQQLQYKADWNNRQYIKIGRFVKTSQTCNVCGYVNAQIKDLSIRKWVCPNCGANHDRDINAAINVLNEGLKILQKI